MQKRIVYLLTFLLLLSLASATVLDDLEDFKNSVGLTEPLIVVLVRVALLLLLTFILFEILSHVGLSQGTSGAVAFILALISTVFIPGSVILAISTTYGTLFALILLMIPILALLFLVYVVIPGNNLGWRILRIILIILVLGLLIAGKMWVNTL
jgi:hypothetical protein